MNRQPSLRRRLLLAGGVGLLLVSLLASALLGELFKRSARDRLDHELQQDMLTLLSQAEVDPDGQLRLRQEPNDARFQRVFSGAYWQIAGADGRVLLQSRSLWDETLPAKAAGPATRNLPGPLQQFLRARVQQVRLPRASEPFVAVVATDRSALDADVAAFRKRTAIALGVLVAAWLAVLASQVHFGLRPLHRLGAQLERVRRGDAQRIDTQGLGAEVAPLGEELNALLDHQQRMVARARTSAQDLAHALKTPLSVLATEADSDGTHWRATVREQSARMQASVDRYLAAGLANVASRSRRQASIRRCSSPAPVRIWKRCWATCWTTPGAGRNSRSLSKRKPAKGSYASKCATMAPAWPQTRWNGSPSVVCGWTSAKAAAGWAWRSWAISLPAMAGGCSWRMRSRAFVRRCGCRWRDAANPTVGSAGRWPAAT